jgi:hypothetical protein
LIPTLIDNHSFEEVDFRKASGVFHGLNWPFWLANCCSDLLFIGNTGKRVPRHIVCHGLFFTSQLFQGVNLLVGQELLESVGLPFIGTSAAAARHAFDKVTFSFFMLQACHIVCDLLFGAKGRITSCILNPKPYHVAHIVGILLSVSCFACTV